MLLRVRDTVIADVDHFAFDSNRYRTRHNLLMNLMNLGMYLWWFLNI